MDELDFVQEPQSPPVKRGLSLGAIVILAGIALTALVFGVALVRQNQTRPTSGPAPDFTLTTYDGETIRLSDLRGKVVVINFWASWCGPCRIEAPDLQAVWERYQDKGVVMLGIAYTDTDSNARSYLAEYGVTYPNAPDLGTRISDLYHITGVPETFIVDQEGQVALFYYVRLTEERLSAALDQLLQNNS